MGKGIDGKVGLAISVTIVLWASAFVGIRAALPHYPPVELAVLRYIIASIVLVPLAYYRKVQYPMPQDLARIALTGVIGFTVYNIALNYGELMVTAASACFIVNGGNLITALLAAVLLKEKVSMAAWCGMIVSLAGIGIISGGEAGSFLVLSAGTLWVFLAAAAQSVYFVLQKALLQKYSSFEMVCYAIWTGTVVMLPMSGDLPGYLLSSPASATLAVVYLGIFPAVVAYFCWAYVLAHFAASQAAVYLFFVPLVTLLIGYLWLGEIPSFVAICGGFVTILGIAITKCRKADKPDQTV